MTPEERAEEVLRLLPSRPLPGSRSYDQARAAIAVAIGRAEADLAEALARKLESMAEAEIDEAKEDALRAGAAAIRAHSHEVKT